jgi:hypothetical protein
MKVLNKKTSCSLLEAVSHLEACVLSVYGCLTIMKPKQTHKNIWMRSEQLIQQRHAPSCVPTPLEGSLQPSECLNGLESLQSSKMFLNMGRRDILRHKSNSKITVGVQLWCSTMWGHFMARFDIALSLWTPHALKSFTENNLALRPILIMALCFAASATSPGQGLYFFFFCCQIIQTCGVGFGKSLTTWA